MAASAGAAAKLGLQELPTCSISAKGIVYAKAASAGVSSYARTTVAALKEQLYYA